MWRKKRIPLYTALRQILAEIQDPGHGRLFMEEIPAPPTPIKRPPKDTPIFYAFYGSLANDPVGAVFAITKYAAAQGLTRMLSEEQTWLDGYTQLDTPQSKVSRSPVYQSTFGAIESKYGRFNQRRLLYLTCSYTTIDLRYRKAIPRAIAFWLRSRGLIH